MKKRRDIDMANVAESQSDLGDRTAGAPGGTLPGGPGGAQGHREQSHPQESQSRPHAESRADKRRPAAAKRARG